jgi:hypothetical protein
VIKIFGGGQCMGERWKNGHPSLYPPAWYENGHTDKRTFSYLMPKSAIRGFILRLIRKAYENEEHPFNRDDSVVDLLF